MERPLRLPGCVFLTLTIACGCKSLQPQTASTIKDENLVTDPATFRYQTPDISPAHYDGPFVIDGPYDFRPDVIADLYRPLDENEERHGDPVDVDRLGTFALCSAPLTKPTLIRDMHYPLGDGRVGLRPIPIVDRESSPWIDDESGDGMVYDAEGPYFNYPPEPVAIPGGKQVVGSEEVDKFIRKTMGWEENDEDAPIFAAMVFTHPEEHRMGLVDLFKNSLKSENGHTHLGAYIGKGMTRNSPYLYHDQK